MFKANSKSTRTYSTPFSSVSIVNFEQVTVSWVEPLNIIKKHLSDTKQYT